MDEMDSVHFLDEQNEEPEGKVCLASFSVSWGYHLVTCPKQGCMPAVHISTKNTKGSKVY